MSLAHQSYTFTWYHSLGPSTKAFLTVSFLIYLIYLPWVQHLLQWFSLLPSISNFVIGPNWDTAFFPTIAANISLFIENLLNPLDFFYQLLAFVQFFLKYILCFFMWDLSFSPFKQFYHLILLTYYFHRMEQFYFKSRTGYCRFIVLLISGAIAIFSLIHFAFPIASILQEANNSLHLSSFTSFISALSLFKLVCENSPLAPALIFYCISLLSIFDFYSISSWGNSCALPYEDDLFFFFGYPFKYSILVQLFVVYITTPNVLYSAFIGIMAALVVFFILRIFARYLPGLSNSIIKIIDSIGNSVALDSFEPRHQWQIMSGFQLGSR
jgi:hypothetical protein